MAGEMAMQQSTAAKIDAQGGVNGFTNTQSIAAGMSAAAQQGELKGKMQQDLQAQGMSKDDAAKKIEDALKKGGDEVSKKIQDALKNINDLEKNKANFASQQDTAGANREFEKATTGKNKAFNKTDGTMTDLGQEAYDTQGSNKYIKDTEAFTDSAKEKQNKLDGKMEKELQNYFELKGDSAGKAKAKAEAIMEASGLKNKNGQYATGESFMNAQEVSRQMNANFTLDNGATINAAMGSSGISGSMNTGFSMRDDTSETFSRGAKLNYNAISDAGINTFGVDYYQYGQAVSQVGGAVMDIIPIGRKIKTFSEAYKARDINKLWEK